jgi:predicted RecB family nuclease
MVITSSLFEAYIKCPTKCFLQSLGETGRNNDYAEWVRTHQESYRVQGRKRLENEYSQDECIVGPVSHEELTMVNWRIAVDLVAQTPDIKSQIHAVERVSSERRGIPARFIPIRFVFANKITRDDKLLLAFDALSLSEMLGRTISQGRIIHGENRSTATVKTSALVGNVRKLMLKIATMLSDPSPPGLVLNRHCAECEFRERCRQKAGEKDDLSLLSGMTEKERTKYNGKGIFTVTQLSYTFRPRRRSKRSPRKREKYHYSLKALAIRNQKIYVVGSPSLSSDGTPVYLDIEGLPDRDFYYLVGIRLTTAEVVTQHNLWADTADDEKRIWADFLDILLQIKNPILIHYGSFETTFLKRMCGRYKTPLEGSSLATVLKSTVNLLSAVYAQVYFPTYSNGLKEIAGWLGFKWSEDGASGIQSMAWRLAWEESGDPALKRNLVTYNSEDCQALEVVAKAVDGLAASSRERGASTIGNTVDVDLLEPQHLKWGKFSSPISELERINDAAQWDYQRGRIYARSSKVLKHVARKANDIQRSTLRPNKIVRLAAPGRCPRCGRAKIYRHAPASKTVLDVRFSSSGIKRWVTKYLFHRYRCPACAAVFHNQDRPWQGTMYGPDLRAFLAYLNVEMKIPQKRVVTILNQLLGFNLALGLGSKFKAQTALQLNGAYEAILQRIVQGRLVHADETKVSVQGKAAYVWVFTSLEEVAYVFAPSREGDLIHTLLKEFKGVLVSDFYGVYDSLNCAQQKCLIHLIRDINDDLLNEPFNEELKGLVGDFAGLLGPMIETVDRFGLKARFLHKHKLAAGRFFRLLSGRSYQTEAAAKWGKRFEKNRASLFTFLDYDGVPWNNNNAEHAIKAFALLRRDFGGVSTEKGIREYLILLSVCESCKYMGADFLDFLRSGETDIYAFAAGTNKA